MRTFGKGRVVLTAAAAALAMSAAVLPATAAVARSAAPSAASWKVSLKLTGSGFPTITAVTATSATRAWAFGTKGSAAPFAYKLSGSTWTKTAFPGSKGDQVFSAASSSASNVWAFTFQGRVLHYNGATWSQVKKFAGGKPISSGLTVSSHDTWVFGNTFDASLGTWHYNGSTWSKSASGSGLAGGYALSAKSIWAYGNEDVAHWNGSSWKKTSVKNLLPKNTELSHSLVTGIYAASPKNVYAVASGGREDEGGGFVLLHYNGSHWKRLLVNNKLGTPIAVVPDGKGGLWIPETLGQNESSMEHYSGGHLHSVSLPYSPAHLDIFAAANAHGSTAALTVGFYHKSQSGTTSDGVILRYES